MYYKIISANAKAKDGGSFDYKPYLPRGKRKGKWTPKTRVQQCSSGYHVSEHWNMWYEKGCRIFEVEVKGVGTPKSVSGVTEKQAFEQIRLIREVTAELVGLIDKFSNTGNYNTGDCNTGNYNTGNYNTGHRNTGNDNTSSYNTGHRNTGDCNTGNDNTGVCNTGVCNTGACNTGVCNSGDRNTGNWNSCDYETGFFNTDQSDTVRVFNKPCSRQLWESAYKPDLLYFKLDPKLGYKGSFARAWEAASDKDRLAVRQLPNFDADVFYEISGIDLREAK